MLNDAVTARSSAQLDPATHAECLEFIRAAIAEGCQNGYADRAAIWQSLSADEQSAFTALLKEPEPITLDCGF